jgi:DNA-binding NarL/FixJ family response regulator
MTPSPISILSIDDNFLVAAALQRAASADPGIRWLGALSTALDLKGTLERLRPDVLLLDFDIPECDTLKELHGAAGLCPWTRVLMLSGFSERGAVDAAIDAGAWGYLTKDQSMADIFAAVRSVHRGEFVLSPEVLASAGDRLRWGARHNTLGAAGAGQRTPGIPARGAE